MGPFTTSSVIPLAAAVAAAYCIIGLQKQNGLFDMLNTLAEEHPTRLPDSDVDGALIDVGDSGFGKFLLVLVRFFYPIMTGESPRLSLFSFWFAGQVISMHTLLVLEGLREGNRGRMISYTVIWGVLYQLVPFGVTISIWVAVWMWTSPIAKLSAATPQPVLRKALGIGNADLSVVIHSIVWGFVIPTVLLGLPSSSPQITQRYIIIWQFFPIYVSFARFVFSNALQFLGVDNSVPAPPPADPKKPGPSLTKRLRAVYFPALVMTAAVHTLTLMWVFFPDMRPAMLEGASIDFVDVFKPTSRPGYVVPISTAADGVLNLLHYDMYFGGAAVLYWAAQMYWASTNAPSMASVLTVLVGPGGAALALVWRRDEQLLVDLPEASKKDD
ncbi:hypothetical protein PpBr36_03800 [Pyricularia pennisetigena]|uniref:hypothetical protein n=1 Tax=Pyricularia pennisetigena TaxID=1578925 RepID=UPI001152A0F7|nr:hypothetical protein PpBr36_03800 [Pyricularia pennisetigena]TLS30248.1 hypothetical protein PpBr36_03800 [Pyricularia pennisetigena]